MDLVSANASERQIHKLEQRIKNISVALGHCIASTGFLFIGLTVAIFAANPGQIPLNGKRFIVFLIPAAFAVLAVMLRWYRGRAESNLRRLKETDYEQPEGVWPPAPQEPS